LTLRNPSVSIFRHDSYNYGPRMLSDPYVNIL